MKKILSAILICCLLLATLCACNSENQESNNTISNEETAMLTKSSTSDSSQPQDTSITSSPIVAPSQTPEPIVETSPTTVTVSLEDATNFSDGIAWVRFSAPEAGYYSCVGLLTTTGEVITSPELANWDRFGSDFSNGYSFINSDDGKFVIVDENGNIAVQSPEDGTYKIITGGDGVYLVYQEVKNYDTNEERYGFIDTSGTWIESPVVDHPLYYDTHNSNSLVRYSYRGENVFLSYWTARPDIFTIYNAATGESKQWEVDADHIYYGDRNERMFTFGNGVMLMRYDNSLETISFDNSTSDILLDIPVGADGASVIYNNGIFFTGLQKFTSTYVITNGAFYNLTGEKVLDFSEHTAVMSNSEGFFEFDNGVAAVKLMGADKEIYVCHVDISGNLLYDPVKVQDYSNYDGHGFGSSTAIYVQISPSEYVILKSDGTTIPCDALDLNAAFYDGLAWSDSEQCFINTDGQKLCTFLTEP